MIKSSARWPIMFPALFLVCMAALAIMPFIFMFITSLTSKRYLSFNFDPSDFSIKNYPTIFNNLNIGRNMLNSVIVTFFACFFNCLIGSMAAYGFAKKRFRFREALFMLYLATIMLPLQVKLIPVYTIIRYSGLMNTYPALFLPAIDAFGVFLIRQFMFNVPDELLEAANIDGCGESRKFFIIVIPLIKPVLVSLTIFTFINCWNDFLWPLVITTRPKMQTLTLALATLRGNYQINYGLVMSGATIAFLPSFFLFLILQKQFVEGITLSGIKG
ncbi:MAG: carbohydrate ABC transporter permease [Spirochaetaceae bacterium]|nr:carbohydrate ABC transporter permease [Spirochaetaceae bacterium]